jgi:hypothetical protein
MLGAFFLLQRQSAPQTQPVLAPVTVATPASAAVAPATPATSAAPQLAATVVAPSATVPIAQPAAPTTLPAVVPTIAAIPPTAATPIGEGVRVVATETIALVRGTPVRVPPESHSGAPAVGDWWRTERPVEPQLMAEVERAYNRFWEVRSDALVNLQPEALVEVMDGDMLRRERAFIDELRAKNQAQQVVVEHDARVLYASADEAAVEDRYISREVLVDAATRQPLQAPANDLWQMAYRFRKIGGTWKAVEAVKVKYG